MVPFSEHSDWIFEHSTPNEIHDLHSPLTLPTWNEQGSAASSPGVQNILQWLWHQNDTAGWSGASGGGLSTSALALLHPGSGSTSSSVDPAATEAPTLTVASNALTVTEGGSVALPISVTPAVQGDPTAVTIKGLTNYETITDNLDHQVFSGSTVILSAAEVNSGLTLASSYSGPGHPVNTLSATATEIIDHHAVTSAPGTIVVTDPPATSGSTGTGSSGNALTLQVSGDNLNGTDPLIEVFVDGHQVGNSTYTITADHASGQTQTITINSNFDPTVAHQVQIKFINDSWDGTAWWTNGTAPDGHDVNVY
ncbi:MAG TPA: carbohydrate-binding domain-containing protein, partial [Stellaceae bacterium]|nr:carbohydrate-binding domain-containing protein [Stellaceae bacterium]